MKRVVKLGSVFRVSSHFCNVSTDSFHLPRLLHGYIDIDVASFSVTDHSMGIG